MILEIRNLTAGYSKTVNVLQGINLNIKENEVVAIVGQNGAGKSTIIKAIVNMLPYKTGKILFNGEEINNIKTEEIIKKGIGYFMQGGRIFPHLTVEENISFAGSNISKKEFIERKKKIETYIPLIKNTSNKKFTMEASYLSGGEKTQLALAMVLMIEPELLILDEPSAGLSPDNAKKLYKTLEKIKIEEKLIILLIEQNVKFASKFSDILKLLKNGIIEKKDMSLEEIEENYFGNINNNKED